jgi:hypothetical protein
MGKPIYGNTSAQNQAAQQAASQASGAAASRDPAYPQQAPVVSQVNPIIDPTPQQGLQALSYVTINLPDNNPLTFSYTGDYFFIDTISNVLGPVPSVVGLSAQADTINTNVILRYAKQGTKWPRAFNSLRIQNGTGQALVIKAWVGFGEIVTQFQADGPSAVGAVLRRGSQSFAIAIDDTPYAVNDIVNSAAANKIDFTGIFSTPNHIASGNIVGAQIIKTGAGTTNASFRLFLFQTTTILPPTYNDHAPFAMAFASDLVGVIDFPSFVSGGAGSDSALCNVADISIPFLGGATDSVYGVLVALAAYNPDIGQQFKISLYGNTSAYSGS